MDRPSPEVVQCPHCGARNFAIDAACAECLKDLAVYIGPRPRIRRFGLGSVMVAIAAVAVCLAPARTAPPLSILLALVLVPTVTRAILNIEGRRADGRPMRREAMVGEYLTSLGIVLVIEMSAMIAFIATCMPTGFVLASARGGPPVLPFVIGLGLIAAVVTIYQVGRRLWPRRD